MDKKPSEILTIEELPSCLKISKTTLCKLVRKGKVLCQKIGLHFRFQKEAIDHWLEETHDDTKDGGNE